MARKKTHKKKIEPTAVVVTSQRQSNMELLRIVSILLIVIFHCVYKSGFSFEPGFSANKLIVKTFWMFGELGVNLFILLSGYFMITSKFKWRKLVLLLTEVSFYHLLITLFACRIGIYQVEGIRNIFLAFFFPITLNRYWFITAYIIVYLLSPYFNVFAHAMDQRIYKKFLFTVLFLYSLMPTVFGVFFNTTETLLYYNRLIWLIIMYFVGAYIRLYALSMIRSMKAAMMTSASAFGVMIGSILLIDHFNQFFAVLGTMEIAYFWPPNTVPMVFLSLGVFGVFLHIKMPYNVVINRVASTTLGIYILHDGILARWLWRTVIQCANYQNSPCLIFHILVAGGVFLAGMLIDLGRQVLEKYVFYKILDSKLVSQLSIELQKFGNRI